MFDVAVAMFVMSVVPDPKRVLDEMRRVVRPGGTIVTVNHFKADKGGRATVERWLTRYGASLGWHPEFAIETVLGHPGMTLTEQRGLPPIGIYTLLVFRRD
jgi:phosphatidylethanolamine/phosphatidyl-N-methylethanolamine N-methyltransferase